jgi:hypothetical protein
MIEGLSTFEETELTSGGRGRSPGAEMFLRMAALEGPFPTLDQMAVFPDDWPAGQVPYLFGESFLRHLAGRFGRGKVAEISRAYAGRPLPYFVESTGEAVLGEPYRDLWREWSAALRERFEEQRRDVVSRGATPSAALTADGNFNGSPAWSPDGRRIAWLRDDGHGFPGVWVMNADGSDKRRLVKNDFSTASSGATLAWSPDGGRIYYTKRGYVRGAAVVNDIHAWDFAQGREFRVTRGLRARDPHPSPDGRSLALVTSSRGRTRLALLDLDGELPVRESSRLLFLTESSVDQLAAPRWSPDGARIAVSSRRPDGAQEILVLDRECREIARTTRDFTLAGGQSWSADGARLYFSSDRTGIFNLFAWDIASGTTHQLTNVLGGAFSPAPSPDGRRIAFTEYTARGYDIHLRELSDAASLPPTPAKVNEAPNRQETRTQGPSADFASRPYSALDTILPRLWLPWFASSPESGTLGGFITGGQDAAQRHRYLLSVLYGPESGRLMHLADYAYDGLRPTLRLISSDVDQTYSDLLQVDGSTADYTERERLLGAEATLAFPGFEVSQALTLGYRYRELSALTPLPPESDTSGELPAVGSLGSTRLTWSISSAHRQRFSISPEEGLGVSLGLERFQEGLGSDYSFTRAVADWTQYLGLPRRHHVLAARLFLGGADGEVPPQGAFLLGGDATGDISFSLDDRSLPLRGYPEGFLRGSRALLASLEYRFPLLEIGRGGVSAPFFLRRLHGALFVDAGEAWDGDGFRSADLRTGVGAEARLDLYFSYFAPLTLRLGVAAGLDEGGGIYPTLGLWIPQSLTGSLATETRR